MREFTDQGLTKDHLRAAFMKPDDYKSAHQSLVIFCHDIFIKYKGGILLIIRNNEPAKNLYWPIGGRVLRGVSVEDSLRIKTKEECNLEIFNLHFLEFARTYFSMDPFGHQKGTDTINAVYFAEGSGDLSLDKLHEKPTILDPQNLDNDLMNKLHPYVNYYLHQIIDRFF